MKTQRSEARTPATLRFVLFFLTVLGKISLQYRKLGHNRFFFFFFSSSSSFSFFFFFFL